jgi:hypothetical protein
MVSNSEAEPPKADKMVTRRAFATAVVIIIILSSVLAFVAVDVYHFLPRHFDYDDYYFYHRYSLKVFPATPENYSLLISIPVVQGTNTTHHAFLENLHVDSVDVSFELKTTEHGIALQISGSSSANISWSAYWEKDSGELYYSSLSMLEPSNISQTDSAVSFFKSSGTPVGFSIEYHALNRYGYGGHERDFFIDAVAAEDGWHQAAVTIGAMLIN